MLLSEHRIRGQVRRQLLWRLMPGFALVILVLIGTSVAAIRSARSVQQSAARLTNEQALAMRLISELQYEQAALNVLSYQFTGQDSAADRQLLMETLRDIDDLLTRLSQDSLPPRSAALRAELQSSAKAFSTIARRILETHDSSPAALKELFAAHDRVLRDVAALMKAGAERSSAVEAQIMVDADEGLRESLALLALALVLSMLSAVLTARAVTELVSRMQEQEGELSRVSWQMLETQESSLRRFSHELHDDLGQSLAAVRAMVENLQPETLESKREECLTVVDGSIANVRELSQLLRPVILDDFGLDASLRWLGERFSERTGIAWRYDSNFEGRLPDEVETHLFRITQEALTNVARHSQATLVEVELRDDGNGIWLRIADNGSGLAAAAEEKAPADPEAPPRLGLGLRGMQARAERVDGEVRISSPNSGGVIIQVFVPLSDRPC